MSAFVGVLQALAALATIVLCVFVVMAVIRLRQLAERVDDHGRAVLENLAALSGLAREQALPYRAAQTLEELQGAFRKVGQAADRVAETVARLEGILASEEAGTVPAATAQFLARGNELLSRLNETAEVLQRVIDHPATAVMRLSDTVVPVVEDARRKVGLARTFVEAVKCGLQAGWQDLLSPGTSAVQEDTGASPSHDE